MNGLSDDVERSSERSDACSVASFRFSVRLCRHLIRFHLFQRGSCRWARGACGRAEPVQAGVGNAGSVAFGPSRSLQAFSMPAAGSTGLRPRKRPRRLSEIRRSRSRSYDRTSDFKSSERSDVDHGLAFGVVFGAAFVFRIERPLSSMRWALWSRRSQMASAWLGSPITPCQSLTGT